MLKTQRIRWRGKKLVSPHHLCDVCVCVFALFILICLPFSIFSGQKHVCVCTLVLLLQIEWVFNAWAFRLYPYSLVFLLSLSLPLPLPLLPQNPFKHMHIYSLVSPSKRSYPVTYSSSYMIAILLLSLYFYIFPCRVCVCVCVYSMCSVLRTRFFFFPLHCATVLLVSIICTLSTMYNIWINECISCSLS